MDGRRSSPAVEVTSKFSTRDRAIDLSKPGSARPLSAADHKLYTDGTELIPTDGIVKQTSDKIVASAKTTSTRHARSTSGSSTTRSATPRRAAAASAISPRCSRPATSAANAPTLTRSMWA